MTGVQTCAFRSRAVVGDGMVDGHEAAAALDLLHPGAGLVAEVDDADLAPRVGVPAVGGHLLPGDQGDAVAARDGGEVGVVAGRVVVSVFLRYLF